MTRTSLAAFLIALVVSAQVCAYQPVYKWPSGFFYPGGMKDARYMAELCIESNVGASVMSESYFVPPSASSAQYNRLSDEEAKKEAETFCEGALAGLVRGLEHADPPYGLLSQLSECSADYRSARILDDLGADRLRVAFEWGYRGRDTAETTTQALLRGLWQMFECQGEPPEVAATK